MSAPHHETRPLFQSLLAGFAAVLVVALGLLAQSPAAHAWLHSAEAACESDSATDHSQGASHTGAKNVANPDHACAVTIFAQGADHVAPTISIAPFSALFSHRLAPETAQRFARLDHLLPPGQAPPAV